MGRLTDSCPARLQGLMGEETDMVGPPFWDSKELEPEAVTQQGEPLSFSSGFYQFLMTSTMAVYASLEVCFLNF